MSAKDDLQGAAGLSARQLAEDEEDAARINKAGWASDPDDDDGQGDDDTRPRATFRQRISPANPGVTLDEDSDIPPIVAKYLKSDETHAVPMRQHQALLLVPAVVFLGGLLAAIALNSWAYETGHNPPFFFHAIWISWVIAALWSLWRYYQWRQTWFVITGHRVMLIETTAKLGRKITMLPVDKMRDCEYSQTVIGRMVGYATFRFSSIGTERALSEVSFLPYPEWIYQRISELTMPADERRAIKRNK